MAYTPHQLVKNQDPVGYIVGALQSDLGVASLVRRESADQFKGRVNDTVTFRVPGFLPARTHGWRNDRSQAIEVDQLSETTVNITFGNDCYSATEITPEQYDFDLGGSFGRVLEAQSQAVARYLKQAVIDAIVEAPFSFKLGGTATNLVGAMVEARRIMNRVNLPAEGRILIVGSDYEAALLNDPKVVLSQNVGHERADRAAANAFIGRLYGFDLYSSNDVPADKAIAMIPDTAILATAAPSVSLDRAGAASSYDGFAMRWSYGHDIRYRQDVSLVDTFYGVRPVLDFLIGYDKANKIATRTTAQHFVRAIELGLTGTSVAPAAGSELALASGVSDAALWTP